MLVIVGFNRRSYMVEKIKAVHSGVKIFTHKKNQSEIKYCHGMPSINI